jgi:TolA-binding protein
MERSFLKPKQPQALRIIALLVFGVIFSAYALFAQSYGIKSGQPASSSPDEILQNGYRAYYEHDWVTATNAYRSVIGIPGYATPENYFMLILSQKYATDYANAVVDGENFLVTFPKSEYIPYMRYHIGHSYYLMGNFVNAAYHLTEFCHAYPGHELYASALFWIAECFFAREQYQEALALYERIVRDYPQEAKRADSQARIETIRFFRRTDSQITSIRSDLAKIPSAPSAGAPVQEPGPGASQPDNTWDSVPGSVTNTSSPVPASGDNALDQQREFVSSLLTLSAQLNKDKDVVNNRLEIVTALIARNTLNGGVQQWTPEQQRYIADLLARNAAQTNAYGNFQADSSNTADQIERLLAELLTKNAEFTYRQAPVAEREKFIADLNMLSVRLADEKSRIDGQQRVLAELITSSMGLSNTGAPPSPSQRGAIGEKLESLPGSTGPESAEYNELLNKARSLWNVIEDRNRTTSRGGGGF